MPDTAAQSAGENLKRIMTDYYRENHERAASGEFVVWIAIVTPVELLKGFDLLVCVPENHSAMCAARGMGAAQAESAEKAGYSMDLCSYARIDLGTVFNQGAGSPSLGLPRPDLLISNNNNCSLLVKWFDVYHREFGVPHFVLDIPFCYETQRKKNREYIVRQFQDLIRTIEGLTGQTFNADRARAALEESGKSIRHWKRFMNHAAHRPSGITAFDTFAHMAPYFTWMRGRPEMTDHFKLLADEVARRTEAGDFPVPNEKYRLLWDSIAPWHQLRKMSSRLAGMDANIVYSSYTSCLGSLEGEVDMHEYDGSDPLEFLAREQNMGVCCYGLDLRMRAMKQMIDRFEIDGVVFAGNRSCKVYSIMQMDQRRILAEEMGVPSVMIDVDHADVRQYDESAVFSRLDTFMETMSRGRTLTGTG